MRSERRLYRNFTITCLGVSKLVVSSVHHQRTSVGVFVLSASIFQSLFDFFIDFNYFLAVVLDVKNSHLTVKCRFVLRSVLFHKINLKLF